MSRWKSWLERGLSSKKTTTQQPGRGHRSPPPFLLGLWSLMDKIISKWLGIEPLRKDKMGIISNELRRHRGQPVQLNNGTVIIPGDQIIELHMNNAWFLHERAKLVNSTAGIRWKVSSAFTEDLRYLARHLARGSYAVEIKALHGTTTLYSPAQRLGFTVVEIPKSIRRRLTTFYLSGLRRTYYFGESKEYAMQRKPPVLKEVWMSKSRLLEKYSH